MSIGPHTVNGSVGLGSPPLSEPPLRPPVEFGERFDWRNRRVSVLLNTGCRRGETCGLVAQKLASALHDLGARSAEPRGDMAEQCNAIAEADPDIVVSLGGDGTIRTAARLAIDHDAALLVLPLGTMNLVAHDIGLPLDIDQTLSNLANLREQRIDYATVNGELFLHSSLLGVIPSLTVLRERMRASLPPRSRLQAAISFASTPFTVPHLRLQLTTDRGRVIRRTRSLAVTCNPLADAPLGQHRRASVCSGRFGVYASVHHGPLAPLRMIASLATARVLRDPDFHTGICESITISSRHASLRVANDGEVKRISTPLHYEMHPCALRVLVPPPPEPEAVP